MKNRKFLILIFTSLVLFAFAIYRVKINEEKKWETPIYCKYVYEINDVFIKEVKSQYGLTYSGGGGGFLKNVELVSICFRGKGSKRSVEESRVMLINCVENLLNRINSEEKLKPYLEHVPFSNKGFKISIGFSTKFDDNEKSVAHVFNVDDKVLYSYYNSEGNLTRLYEETYEEALRIVKEQGKLEQSSFRKG